MGLVASGPEAGGMGAAVEGDETAGYRVLDVVQGSPAARAGMVQCLDFVLVANGVRVDRNDGRLASIIAASENEPLNLSLYNVVTETIREVIVTPRRWADAKMGLLGCAICFDTYATAKQTVASVQEVVPGSPADRAGMRPQTDTIIGANDASFPSLESLAAYLRRSPYVHSLYLYNDVDHSVRQVTVDVSAPWGPQGLTTLGASVAHGKLHELRISDKLPVNAWSDTCPGPVVAASGAPLATLAASQRAVTTVPGDTAPAAAASVEGASEAAGGAGTAGADAAAAVVRAAAAAPTASSDSGATTDNAAGEAQGHASMASEHATPTAGSDPDAREAGHTDHAAAAGAHPVPQATAATDGDAASRTDGGGEASLAGPAVEQPLAAAVVDAHGAAAPAVPVASPDGGGHHGCRDDADHQDGHTAVSESHVEASPEAQPGGSTEPS